MSRSGNKRAPRERGPSRSCVREELALLAAARGLASGAGLLAGAGGLAPRHLAGAGLLAGAGGLAPRHLAGAGLLAGAGGLAPGRLASGAGLLASAGGLLAPTGGTRAGPLAGGALLACRPLAPAARGGTHARDAFLFSRLRLFVLDDWFDYLGPFDRGSELLSFFEARHLPS